MLVVSPNNPTGSFVSRGRARPARRAVRAARTSRSSPTRCSPTTSSSRGAARRAAASPTRDDVLVVRARRAVEVGRAAAGEARMDRRRRARIALVDAALARLELICDTYLVGVDARAGGRGRAARARRRRPAADSDARRDELSRAACRRSARVPRCGVLRSRGRLVRRDAGAVARAGRGSRRSTC